MTKFNFSPLRKLSYPTILFLLLLPGKMDAQEPSFLQEALQSCLEHPGVKPYLRSVSFRDHIDVLAVAKNSYVGTEMKLEVFGKEAIISEKTELFFFEIEEYLEVIEVLTEKDKLILTFKTGPQFTCTYSGNKNKVKKLLQLDSE